ncbi:MAG: flagellin [Phycisphaerales bacterium]|nr:flagellin [Phycisphaerales bacterium]
MARINTNVSALNAQRNLNRAYAVLNQTMEHLSTGLRISRGKDDPAGLIVSERLRSEISAVGQAISNTQRAKLVVSTTEGALDEVAALLKDIQAKIVESANSGAMSDDEVRANQLQIDSAIDSITRIANTTSFGGRRVLDGSLHYSVSGVNSNRIAAQTINAAQFGSLPTVPVTVRVISQAQRASASFPFAALSTPITVEVKGRLGVASLSFGSATTVNQVALAIAAVRDSTGVSATTSGSVLKMVSTGVGKKELASIKVLSGSTPFITDTERRGTDAVATVNGALAQADGVNLTVKTASLDADLTISTTFPPGSSTTFNVTGGGALFQVGPRVNTNLQVNVGVPSVAASNLGNPVVGYLATLKSGGPNAIVNSGVNFKAASDIVAKAIDQVSVLRGRLGAFERGTLDANINQLGITMENLTSAESNIRDADFAGETSQLARNQILVNAGTTVLTLANQTTQSVLRLLGS